MSAYDRMKQVKDLLANPASLHLKSNISLNNIARLLNDSKSKVNQLLISQNQSSKASSTSPPLPSSSSPDKSIDVTSMKNLTNYVLYDDNATGDCLFDLSDLDQNQVKYFAGEIDAIESELVDMSAQIKSLQNAYKTYYEDFLNLCDRKDELFELFLDYYEEYILNNSSNNDEDKSIVVKSASNKTKIRLKSNRRDNNKSSGPKKQQATDDKENVNNSEDEDQCGESSDVTTINIPRLKSSNLVRRKSNIYIYSVPTENRFSILSRTDNGTTLIKHY